VEKNKPPEKGSLGNSKRLLVSFTDSVANMDTSRVDGSNGNGHSHVHEKLMVLAEKISLTGAVVEGVS
jgi:hypothetical protein